MPPSHALPDAPIVDIMSLRLAELAARPEVFASHVAPAVDVIDSDTDVTALIVGLLRKRLARSDQTTLVQLYQILACNWRYNLRTWHDLNDELLDSGLAKDDAVHDLFLSAHSSFSVVHLRRHRRAPSAFRAALDGSGQGSAPVGTFAGAAVPDESR